MGRFRPHDFLETNLGTTHAESNLAFVRQAELRNDGDKISAALLASRLTCGRLRLKFESNEVDAKFMQKDWIEAKPFYCSNADRLVRPGEVGKMKTRGRSMGTISKPAPAEAHFRPGELNRPCPVCGHSSRQRTRQWCAIPEFAVLRCRDCGVTFINEAVNDNLGFAIEAGEEPDPILMLKAANDFKRLEARLAGLARRPDRSLLDVGCGSGYFLHEVEQHGWRVAGLELSQSLATYARERYGLLVDKASIESPTRFPSESFDLITMFGVIEHLAHPRRAVEECTRLLRPDGVLVLQTPSEDGLIRRVGRFLYWATGGAVRFQVRQLYQMGGGHSVCFNRTSMRTLLGLCGLEVISSEQSTYGFRVLLHRFKDLPIAKKIVQTVGTLAVFSLGRIVGGSNHMTVYARKRAKSPLVS